MAQPSAGHPSAFRLVGIPQQEKSWYMLLFRYRANVPLNVRVAAPDEEPSAD